MSAALLAAVAGIAVLDSLNPTLFVAQFYLLTTARPERRVMAYIAGVLVVNFAGGVLLLLGAQALLARYLTGLSPRTLAWAGLALGVALVVFGLRFVPGASPAGAEAPKPRSLRPVHAFALGMGVMVSELTTALPYFAAIDRITRAGMGLGEDLLALVLYNAVFALPLLAFLGLYVRLHERFTAQLDRISAAVRLWSFRILRYGSLGLGVYLVAASGWALARG